MAGKDEYRIFVGGLSWDVTERYLESAFSRFGKILDAQIMMERDTGRPRGFGFITFSDRRGMETSIREMHGQELGDRIISVNKAEPKLGGDEDRDFSGAYHSGGRASGGGGFGGGSVGQDECFKCGRHGHWARECPSSGGRGANGNGGPYTARPRFGGDRYGGDRDRYVDDRYNAGRYGERDRFDRDDRYGGRDRYVSDRYASSFSGERYGASDRYGSSDRYAQNGYGKDRGYERDVGPRIGGERYNGAAGGLPRGEGRSYRSRPGPYDRPARLARPSSLERY